MVCIEAAEKEIIQKKRYHAIFDHTHYAIVITDFETGRYIDANHAFLELQGISKQELSCHNSTKVSTVSEQE